MPIGPLTASKRRREDEVRKRLGLVLGMTILIGGSTCLAQQALIPFKQLQWNAETPPPPAAVERAEVSAASSILLPSTAVSDSSAVASPLRNNLTIRGTDSPRLGAGFFLLNGLNIGMTALDMSLSQRCVAEHHCREANPLMPPSLAGRISVVAVFAGLGTYVSHRLKKQGSRLWWLAPAFGTAAHSVGAASGFANQ